MNNNQNTRLTIRSCEQQNNQGWCNFACFQKVVSNFSTVCSFAGASLFGVIFFGLADTLDYRNTRLIYECAHCMVIAAVGLFLLSFLLSFFKQDSKQNNAVDVTQTNVGDSVQFKNGVINISTNELNVTDKLKLVESNTKVKQSAISENVKPTDTSSKILKFSNLSKQEEIVTRALPSSSSCKNLHTDQSTLPPNISSKTHNHANLSKQGESTRTLSLHTSSKTLQHDNGKQKKSANILSRNISSKVQKSSISKLCDSAKVLSPSISSKLSQHESKSEQKAKTLNIKPHSQNIDRQLVLYEKHPKIPFYEQNLHTSPPYQRRNFCEFMAPSASGCSPVTEITATKRMTVAPWGVAQEEYQIHQRTFYHDLQNPVNGISSHGLKSTLNNNLNSGSVQEYQISQTTFYQRPPHLGGRNTFNVFRPKHDSDQINQPRRNKIADVLSQFESMNIFH